MTAQVAAPPPARQPLPPPKTGAAPPTASSRMDNSSNNPRRQQREHRRQDSGTFSLDGNDAEESNIWQLPLGSFEEADQAAAAAAIENERSRSHHREPRAGFSREAYPHLSHHRHPQQQQQLSPSRHGLQHARDNPPIVASLPRHQHPPTQYHYPYGYPHHSYPHAMHQYQYPNQPDHQPQQSQHQQPARYPRSGDPKMVSRVVPKDDLVGTPGNRRQTSADSVFRRPAASAAISTKTSGTPDDDIQAIIADHSLSFGESFTMDTPGRGMGEALGDFSPMLLPPTPNGPPGARDGSGHHKQQNHDAESPFSGRFFPTSAQKTSRADGSSPLVVTLDRHGDDLSRHRRAGSTDDHRALFPSSASLSEHERRRSAAATLRASPLVASTSSSPLHPPPDDSGQPRRRLYASQDDDLGPTPPMPRRSSSESSGKTADSDGASSAGMRIELLGGPWTQRRSLEALNSRIMQRDGTIDSSTTGLHARTDSAQETPSSPLRPSSRTPAPDALHPSPSIAHPRPDHHRHHPQTGAPPSAVLPHHHPPSHHMPYARHYHPPHPQQAPLKHPPHQQHQRPHHPSHATGSHLPPRPYYPSRPAPSSTASGPSTVSPPLSQASVVRAGESAILRKGATGDGSGQKRPPPCKCKKSKCLKLYCDCFGASAFCIEGSCRCIDCHNKPGDSFLAVRTKAMKEIKSKNPNAFKPRFDVVATSESNIHQQAGAVPVGGAQHNMGCKCSKTGCLKKYCECFKGGILCCEKCKCQGCHNRAGSQKLIDARRKMKDDQGARFAMKAAHDVWQRSDKTKQPQSKLPPPTDQQPAYPHARPHDHRHGGSHPSSTHRPYYMPPSMPQQPYMATSGMPRPFLQPEHVSAGKGPQTASRHYSQPPPHQATQPPKNPPTSTKPTTNKTLNAVGPSSNTKSPKIVTEEALPHVAATSIDSPLANPSPAALAKKRSQPPPAAASSKKLKTEATRFTEKDTVRMQFFGPTLPALPKTAALKIFSYLSAEQNELNQVALVCQSWKHLVQDGQLWELISPNKT